MVLSKTGVLMGVILFYSILSVFIGMFASEQSIYLNDDTEPATGLTSFFGNIVSGYKELPNALNLVIFGSLLTIIGWIAISSLPTVNGGS